jgi:hypothetical protein
MILASGRRAILIRKPSILAEVAEDLTGAGQSSQAELEKSEASWFSLPRCVIKTA